MDNFNLKQYLVEGKLHKSNLNENNIPDDANLENEKDPQKLKSYILNGVFNYDFDASSAIMTLWAKHRDVYDEIKDQVGGNIHHWYSETFDSNDYDPANIDWIEDPGIPKYDGDRYHSNLGGSINENEDYNDVVEWDWEYISINRKGDVDVPCTITLDYGDEPFHVHLPAGELASHGINVEGKEPVELTDGETEAILDMVEAKIQAEY